MKPPALTPLPLRSRERAYRGISGPPQDSSRSKHGPQIRIRVHVTSSCLLGSVHRSQPRGSPPRCISGGSPAAGQRGQFWPSAPLEPEGLQSAKEKGRKRGGETLLQSCCFISLAPGQPPLPTPFLRTDCRRDGTCAAAVSLLPLPLPLLLARCLLGADNEQQIDRYCTGICLKVHGTHQSMTRAPLVPRSCRCCPLPAVLPTRGEASALPPRRSTSGAGPADGTISALPKPILMKRLQVTFERKSQEGSVS